jgi:hypothetical protein
MPLTLGSRHLSWRQVLTIRKIYKTGRYTLENLSRKYGISGAAISNLLLNKTYKCSPAQIKKQRKEVNVERLIRRRAHEKGLNIGDVRKALKKKRCAICGRSKTGRWGTLQLDHYLKIVRGVLCVTCNLGIGCFLDSVVLLRKALKYVSKNGGKKF